MSRLGKMHPDLRRLLLATLFFGAAGGVFMATLNNYLAEVHHLSAEGRGWLEFPRELPGFLIIFVTAFLLGRLSESRIAATAMALTGAGAIGLGLLAGSKAALVLWVIVWSMGDHIIFAVEGPLGLMLAKDGAEGKRLGQLGGARNLGTVLGVGAVFIVAEFLGDRFDVFYLLACGSALLAGFFYLQLRVHHAVPSKRMVVRREYRIFYAISALFGIRKQIFLVFGSWLLVSLHDVPVATIALLYFIASIAGIIFRPLLGEVIDWLGERTVLATDEVLLLLVCLVYAFASRLLDAPYDLWLLYGAYVFDHMLFALRAARTTYLKKIAVDPTDITPTISLGITIDHIVAMSLPILSGWIWETYGFEWVFLLAGGVAIGGFFICLQIRTPTPKCPDSRP